MPYNPYVGGGCRRFFLRVLILALLVGLAVVVLTAVAMWQLNSLPYQWEQRQQFRQQASMDRRQDQAVQLFNRLFRELTALTPDERQQYLGEQTQNEPDTPTVVAEPAPALPARTASNRTATRASEQNLSVSRVHVEGGRGHTDNTRPLFDADGVRLSSAARVKAEDGIRVSSASQALARARRREIAALAQQLAAFQSDREQFHEQEAEEVSVPEMVTDETLDAMEDQAQAFTPASQGVFATYDRQEESSRDVADPETIVMSFSLDAMNDWIELELPQWLANQGMPMPEGVGQIVLSHERGMPMLMFELDYGSGSIVMSILFDLDFSQDGSALFYVHGVRGGRLNLPVGLLMQLGDWSMGQMMSVERLRFVMGAFHGKVFEPVLRVDRERGRRLVDYAIYRNEVQLFFEPADPEQSPLPELR